MPTPTELTPAEITALERDIAERVMGGSQVGGPGYYYLPDERLLVVGVENYPEEEIWSPWRDPAAALEVLATLAENKRHRESDVRPDIRIKSTEHQGLEFWNVSLGWIVSGESPGPHYGPAVCELAKQVMENSK